MPSYFDTRPKPPLAPTKPLLPFTPRNFSLFPKLPSELRLTVWRHALPKGRTIVITHRPHQGNDPAWEVIKEQQLISDRRPISAPTIHYKSTIPHPTILSVCRESRYEALKYYVMIHGPHSFCVAFDNDIDTICAPFKRNLDTHDPVGIEFFFQPGFKVLNLGKGSIEKGPYDDVVRIKSMAVDEMALR